MKLPIFQSDSQEMGLMQTQWASAINPLLSNPLVSGLVLKNVPLATGSTQVNHRLGRKLQGWCLIRKRASADIYDAQDSNSMPELTLSLVSDANVLVDLYVF